MKALVKYGTADKQVEIRNLEVPKGSADKVIIGVRAAGVCGSDVHLWRNQHSWDIVLPLVLGHEFSGEILEVGSEVQGFRVGDRVACETAAKVCGRCTFCLSGSYNMCPGRLGYGALIHGAFTDYVEARPEILHRIPDRVTFEQASLTEPGCVAYNALVEKSDMRPGDVVVIQGPGPIGIMALQVARIRGAGTLVVLGTGADARRLDVASELGADYVLNIEEEDPQELVRSLGDGAGADLIVDCTGVSAALRQGMDLVRPNGQITKIGWGPQPLNFSLDPLVQKAIRLQGSFSHTFATWERVLRLLDTGQINLNPVVGGVYPLGEWHEAFERMESGHSVKSVLVWN